MNNQTRMDLIKCVVIAENEWMLPYRLHLIKELTKDYDIKKDNYIGEKQRR